MIDTTNRELKTLKDLTPEQIKQLKISERIWAVQQEIKTLVKDETNKFQNYKYFDENQILKVLKPLLGKYRLLMLISDDDNKEFIHEREIVQSQKGERVVHYLKYLKVLIITNLDNEKEGQKFKFWACGSNDDLAKAKGSAETYAMKYILSKFFLIRVIDENDPELTKPIEREQKKELTAEQKAQVAEVLNRHNFNNKWGQQ